MSSLNVSPKGMILIGINIQTVTIHGIEDRSTMEDTIRKLTDK
jgi:hypothetical protein